jgi:hypothetical protein
LRLLHYESLEVRKVKSDYVTIDQHFPCIAAEISCTKLLHFLLNQHSFFWRYPNDKLILSGTILHLDFHLFAFLFGGYIRRGFWFYGFGQSPTSTKKISRERKRKRLIFIKVYTFAVLANQKTTDYSSYNYSQLFSPKCRQSIRNSFYPSLSKQIRSFGKLAPIGLMMMRLRR